jgi:tryptophan synthase beta chain
MNVQYFLNINYYLKKHLGELPEPPLHPATKKPVGPRDLAPLFPMELIKQEVTLEEFVPIPDEVREIYQTYRPSPLIRAKRLEKALKTPARIYYKYEGVSPAGSHKLNTALVQAYYAKQEGVRRLVTETGAGQWGSALSMACKFFDLECLVYMVKISFEQKPYRRVIMELFEAKVLSSPTKKTKVGQQFLAEKPNTHGSLGMAIAEAIETVVGDKTSKYSLGSVLNHVLLHQTIIGQEAIEQFKQVGDDPEVIIGCCGGGSNFAGLAFPFLAEKLSGKKPNRRFVGVEPSSCASMSKGEYRYDFGDSGRQTPLLKMETLGCDFVPSPIHAGGLRYHGIAPILAFLHRQKLIEAVNYDQLSVFAAARQFAHAEGIIVAPESAHAVKAVIDEALRAKKEGKKRAIVFNLSGHGLLDLKGYEDFIKGKLK